MEFPTSPAHQSHPGTISINFCWKCTYFFGCISHLSEHETLLQLLQNRTESKTIIHWKLSLQLQSFVEWPGSNISLRRKFCTWIHQNLSSWQKCSAPNSFAMMGYCNHLQCCCWKCYDCACNVLWGLMLCLGSKLEKLRTWGNIARINNLRALFIFCIKQMCIFLVG